MNYYAARQHEEKKTWAYTRMNDKKIYLDACCARHDEFLHKTKEEAERCFWEFQFERLIEGRSASDTKHKCQAPGCEEWTQKALNAGHHFISAYLCDAHLNKETMKLVFPFEPGITITSSY